MIRVKNLERCLALEVNQHMLLLNVKRSSPEIALTKPRIMMPDANVAHLWHPFNYSSRFGSYL